MTLDANQTVVFINLFNVYVKKLNKKIHQVRRKGLNLLMNFAQSLSVSDHLEPH